MGRREETRHRTTPRSARRVTPRVTPRSSGDSGPRPLARIRPAPTREHARTRCNEKQRVPHPRFCTLRVFLFFLFCPALTLMETNRTTPKNERQDAAAPRCFTPPIFSHGGLPASMLACTFAARQMSASRVISCVRGYPPPPLATLLIETCSAPLAGAARGQRQALRPMPVSPLIANCPGTGMESGP